MADNAENKPMERTKLSLDLDDDIDLTAIAGNKPKTKVNNVSQSAIAQSAEEVGFTSRQPKSTRRRAKRTPYTAQKGIKVRPEIKRLFEAFVDGCDDFSHDHEAFEMAFLALVDKMYKAKTGDQKQELKVLLNDVKEALK